MPIAFRRRLIIYTALAAAYILPMQPHVAFAADDEQEAESKVVAVALFKNGLAVIKRQVALPGKGIVRVSDVPEPVHGTFFAKRESGP